jgi:ABC-type transport system substrate-binding protein
VEAEHVSFLSEGRQGGRIPSYYLDLFYTKEGGFSVHSSPEIEKLVAEAKATVLDRKTAEMIRKAVKIIHDEVIIIPIFSTVAVYAMNKNRKIDDNISGS